MVGEFVEFEIHYRNEKVEEYYQNSGIQTLGSAGFDLVCAEDIKFEKFGELKMIDLGVIIKPPEGYHSLVMPRSSTFKKYGIIQSNSVGLIDEDYCGPEDYWLFPVIYLRHGTTIIPAGTRVSQFIFQRTEKVTAVKKFNPGGDSRGGFGSTGN